MFYAQSTGAVISGRWERETEKEEEDDEEEEEEEKKKERDKERKKERKKLSQVHTHANWPLSLDFCLLFF